MTGRLRWLLAIPVPLLLFGCGTAQGPTALDGATPSVSSSALRADNWRQRVSQLHGNDLSAPPRYPRDHNFATGNGFRRAGAAAQRVLTNLLARNRLPQTTATIGIYACERTGPHALVPARHIRLCRGILSAIDDEDTLAFLIAHELAHVLLRHNDPTSRQEFVNREGKSGANARGAVAIGVIGATLATGGWAAVALYSVGGLALRGAERGGAVDLGSMFSRAEELEADRLGVLLAAGAGYNPSTASPFIKLIASGSDTRERPVGEAIDRNREEQLPPSLEWVMRTTASASVSGTNLRTHPDVASRTEALDTVAAEASEASRRAITPISFKGELDERDRAWDAGQWSDDPNLAIGYAQMAHGELTMVPSPDAARRAIAALERVSSNRRPEPVLRNLLIYHAFAGLTPQLTHNAAVDWLNSGGVNHYEAVDILILLQQESLARQVASHKCRLHQEANRGKQDALPCRTYDNYYNDLVVGTRWGTRGDMRLLRHLADRV